MGAPDNPPDSLGELLKRTQQRIDDLDRLTGRKPAQKQPWSVRLSNNWAKHGNLLVNAALTGCVFAVAWGQLRQKYEHQVCAVSEFGNMSFARSTRLTASVRCLVHTPELHAGRAAEKGGASGQPCGREPQVRWQRQHTSHLEGTVRQESHTADAASLITWYLIFLQAETAGTAAGE
jgi:hypothetical protein